MADGDRLAGLKRPAYGEVLTPVNRALGALVR